MGKRRKWFFSEEEYLSIKNSITVPAVIRNSMAVKFLRTWGSTQTKILKLVELATTDEEVLERVKTAIKLIEGYEKALKLDRVVKELRKALKL